MFVIILGGGEDQRPLIEIMARFKLRTIVVDYDANCVGKDISDVFIHRSNRDVNGIVAAVKDLKLQVL